MKRLLFLGILFVSMGVIAGWRWERVDIYPPTDEFVSATYDPVSEKMILISRTDYDWVWFTWSFDGETFKYICTRLPGPYYQGCTAGKIYYDYNLNHLAAISLCKFFRSQPPDGAFVLQLKSDNNCWMPIMEGGSPHLAYDTDRNKLVTITTKSIIEFDGDRFEKKYDGIFEGGSVVYDASIKRTLFWGSSTFDFRLGPLEWDGESLVQADAPLPPNIDRPLWGPICYYPPLGGSVTILSHDLETLLYKDHTWQTLIGKENQLGGMMFFYPKNKMLYMFSGNYLYYLNRSHSRPLSRP